MRSLFSLISLFLIFLSFFFLYQKKISSRSPLLISRLRRRASTENETNQKYRENISDSLMIDPTRNIKISKWDKEDELREKADIHRARLSKYGKSRMNGEMFFKGPKGGIYKLNSRGNKKYI